MPNIFKNKLIELLVEDSVIVLKIKSIIVTKGSRGVIVIVVGNGHGDASSNPGPD